MPPWSPQLQGAAKLLGHSESFDCPEWKMDGVNYVDSVTSKLEDLLVEGNEADGSSSSAMRGDDDYVPHPQPSQPFVVGLVDMAGEVLR